MVTPDSVGASVRDLPEVLVTTAVPRAAPGAAPNEHPA
jgi:hypothetical protein